MVELFLGVMVSVLSLVIMDLTPLIKVCAAFKTICFLSSSVSPSRTLKSRITIIATAAVAKLVKCPELRSLN